MASSVRDRLTTLSLAPPANAREAFLTAVPRLAAYLPVRSVLRLSSVSRKGLQLTRRYAALDLVTLSEDNEGKWRRRFNGEAFRKLDAGPWRIAGVALIDLSEMDQRLTGIPLSRLMRLNIAVNRQVEDHLTLEWLAGCPNLVALDLSGRAVRDLAPIADQLPRLAELRLARCSHIRDLEGTDPREGALVPLARCVALTLLDLSHFHMGEGSLGTESLAPLEALPALRVLILSRCRCRHGQDFRLPSLGSLTALDLSGLRPSIPITHMGLMRGLRSLDLSSRSSGDGPSVYSTGSMAALAVCDTLSTLHFRCASSVDFRLLSSLPLEVLDLRWLNPPWVPKDGVSPLEDYRDEDHHYKTTDLSPLATVGTLRRVLLCPGTCTRAGLELLKERLPGLELCWFDSRVRGSRRGSNRHFADVDAIGEIGERIPEPPREDW